MGLLLSLENRGFVCLCLIFALFLEVQQINGKVYKVGDSAGWTTIGNVNYTAWAYNNTFQLGDVIVFEYNPQFHNVMQVRHAEYRSCNVSSPIVTYSTGNDNISIQTGGHHFFVCGVPGHCQSGQRVDINVRAAAATPPATINPPGATITPSTVPAPSHNDARSDYMPLGWVVLQILMLAGVLFRI
ncbi:hypothetical protein CASFOL_005349 [Castilleja foliolosa]|uniref:Phytocyanin domain-containing protein n=1 Tax=Castilleja foliolosa TaxID=1961234 RepID=A0ABD3E494_9LAMI